MLNREAALVEIYNRIAADRVTLGINSCYRAPTPPLDPKKFPCISMLEGSDEVIKVFFNHKFDYKFIKYHTGIEIDSSVFDSFLAEMILITAP